MRRPQLLGQLLRLAANSTAANAESWTLDHSRCWLLPRQSIGRMDGRVDRCMCKELHGYAHRIELASVG